MAWFTQGSEEYGEHGEMLLNFFLDDEWNNDRVVVRISELVRCLKHFRESVLSNDEHDYEHEMNGQLWAATLGSGQELIDLAHSAWSMALCAMQGMPIPADWGEAVERGLREHGIDVDMELDGFGVSDDER